MAHKKGQGSSRNGRDSNGQRRGMKIYGGEVVWTHARPQGKKIYRAYRVDYNWPLGPIQFPW